MRLIICADNDESGTGQEKAKEAAAAVGGLVAMPHEAGQDFNDLHQLGGLSAVKSIIEAAAIVTDNKLRNLSVTDNE